MKRRSVLHIGPHRGRILPALACVLAGVLRAASAAAPDAAGPDRAALARAGRETLKQFATRPSSWKAATRLSGPAGTRMVVEVVGTPTFRRTTMRLDAREGGGEVLRIIARDGFWYASEGRRAAKYRPYEVPFDVPTAYFFLERSNPQCIVDEKGDIGTYQGTKEGVASYRTPLAPHILRQAESAARALRDIRKQAVGKADEEATRTLGRLQEMIDRGTETRVDVATGMIVRFGSSDRPTEITDFRWLDEVPAEAVRISGRDWPDFATDPTIGGSDDLVVFSHSGMWMPPSKAGDTDARLVDIGTGQYRRIPLRGAVAIPGCFLRGRTQLVVTGVDAFDGSFGLVQIDLRTGENRRLGGEVLAGGMTMMPVISPDGRTVAALHTEHAGDAQHSRLCVLDLVGGKTRLLGDPRDMAWLSWLPGGEALILLDREDLNPGQSPAARVNTISQLDLRTGQLRRIGEGNSPVLLNDGKTILFQDTKSREWKTCNLDGNDLKLFAGGLLGHGFPTPAPDGKRVLMMKFEEGKAPSAVIVPIDGGSPAKPVPLGPGLWTMPAWR